MVGTWIEQGVGKVKVFGWSHADPGVLFGRDFLRKGTLGP